MRYQEFVDSILVGLREFYQDDAVISINTVLCNNNGFREALHIRYTEGDSKICPSIYLDSLYEEYEEGIHDLEHYIDTVVQMRKDYEPDNIIKDNVRKLMDWNSIKDEVYPVLVSQETNDQFLDHHVYTSFLDLAVIYEVRVAEDKNGIASSKVTYGMLNLYGVSKAELHQQALENMKKDGYSMGDLMCQMLGFFADGTDEEEDIELEAGKMYILSNKSKRHGAACLLYEDFLKEKFGNRTAFIIPSSIHETLFIPVIEGMTADELNAMICQVNEAEVRACERLSNHCYLWDGNEQKVKMAA